MRSRRDSAEIHTAWIRNTSTSTWQQQPYSSRNYIPSLHPSLPPSFLRFGRGKKNQASTRSQMKRFALCEWSYMRVLYFINLWNEWKQNYSLIDPGLVLIHVYSFLNLRKEYSDSVKLWCLPHDVCATYSFCSDVFTTRSSGYLCCICAYFSALTLVFISAAL